MRDYLVRRAFLEDLNDIVRLWEMLIKEQFSKDKYASEEPDPEYGKGQFKEVLNSEECAVFLVERNGKVIGFTEVWLMEGDFYFPFETYAYVMHTYIESEHRSYQISISLFKEIEKWSRSKGVKSLQTDVLSFNDRLAKNLEYLDFRLYKMRLVKELKKSEGE